MTTPVSDMYGHTENHIRYSTSLFQQEPTEVCILEVLVRTRASNYMYLLPRSSKSMAWMMDPLRWTVAPGYCA